MNTIFSPPLMESLKAAIAEAGRAKFQGLANGLDSAIRGGGLEKGQKLPPVRDLAWQLGVTPGTVARAYSQLIDAGLLTAGVGKGTFVADIEAAISPVKARSVGFLGATDDTAINLQTPRIPDAGQSELIRAAMQEFASTADLTQIIGYPNNAREAAYRADIAKWVAQAPVGVCSAEDLVLTQGGQAGIMAVLQAVLTGPDPVILIEELTYSGFRRAAQLCRARVVTIPSDEAGPIPQALEEAIREHGGQIFCTSSEVCNPTTRLTTLQRRMEIAEVVKRCGIHVLDDDCYRIGPSEGPSYRALLPHHGWYITSPSKNMSAALRVGAALAPEGWQSALDRSVQNASFGVALPMVAVAAKVLADPRFVDVSRALEVEIAERVKVAVNHLGRFQLSWRSDVPFLWLDLPSGWRVPSFLRAAEIEGVLLKGADDFTPREGRAIQAVRIAVNCWIPRKRFEEGVRKLAKILDTPEAAIAV